jgi:hypothetical protein
VTLAHLSFRAGSVSDGYTHYFICNFSSLKNSKAKNFYRQDAADKSGFLVFLCALCVFSVKIFIVLLFRLRQVLLALNLAQMM